MNAAASMTPRSAGRDGARPPAGIAAAFTGIARLTAATVLPASPEESP